MVVIGETVIPENLYICEFNEHGGFALAQNFLAAELIFGCDWCSEKSNCSMPRFYGYFKGEPEVVLVEEEVVEE